MVLMFYKKHIFPVFIGIRPLWVVAGPNFEIKHRWSGLVLGWVTKKRKDILHMEHFIAFRSQ